MSGSEPTFSIVIPTYDRPDSIARCLTALSAIDFPAGFEVIVANDGSEADLAPIVEEAGDGLDVRLLNLPHAGCATARNVGAEAARGRYVAFTDDDCRPSPSWLSALAEPLDDSPDRMVGGRTINGLPQNPFAAASQTLIGYLYDHYNEGPDRARFFASNNIAVSRERFLDVGGFDSAVTWAAGEDRELCDRWLYHGLPMTYAPEAIVWHDHDLTMSGFWRQHFRYGRGAHYFHQVRASRGANGIQLEPPTFYTRLLRYPFSTLPQDRAAVVAPLMALSQVANAAGYAWELTTEIARERRSERS